MSRKLKPQPKLSVAKKQPPRWQRERNISLVIRIIIPLIIVVALGLVGYWGYDNYVAPWQRPVAKVNDTAIDTRYFVKMLRFLSRTSGATVDKISFPYQVLRIVEDNELIRQEAPTMDIEVTPEEITETIENGLLAVQGNATPSESDLDELYDQWLDQVELSDGDYRQLVETDLLRQRITGYLREHEVPTEAKHIRLFTLNRPSEEEALEALVGLQNGNATLEEELTAGDLGWVPEGIYPELDEVAFGLGAGNMSDPIPTDQGYYILKVSETAESRPVVDEHRERLADHEFEEWLDEKRGASIIEEYPDRISWAVEKI